MFNIKYSETINFMFVYLLIVNIYKFWQDIIRGIISTVIIFIVTYVSFFLNFFVIFYFYPALYRAIWRGSPPASSSSASRPCMCAFFIFFSVTFKFIKFN